jgi:hypothetical protein
MDSSLVDRLDFIFSRFIKLRDTDQYGYGSCIATGKRIYYYMSNGKWVSNCEAGHYIGRANHSTRWMEVNVNAQEVMSNRGGFDSDIMASNIELKFGIGTLAAINSEKAKFGQKTYEIDQYWVRSKIDHYTREVEKMLKNKMF